MRALSFLYLMSSTYIYDGSFSSLLALIVILLNSKNNPKDIKNEKEYIPNLLDTPVYLDLGDIKGKANTLRKRLSTKVIHTIYYVYLSNNSCKELIIYYFIKNAIKYQDEVFYHRNLKCVNEALKISQSVSREVHHMKGFLRFKQMKNNFYYAEMSPTNNVIELLANHFKKRLCNEYWLIKDVQRKIYAFYNLKEVIYLNEDNIKELNIELSNNEENFEDLWKTFFKTIGIKERKNPRAQMNFMPKKYWKYIIEMEDEK